MKVYDPYEYWNSRKHPNTAVDPGIRADERAFLIPFVGGATHVFEFGPGVGRLFDLYASKKVTTLDISRNYSERLQAVAQNHKIQLQEYFRESPSEPFPFGDNLFDVGVVSQVLFHVPFDFIAFTVSELVRTCKILLVINTHSEEWIKDPSDKRIFHCYAHDFYNIARDLNFKLVPYVSRANRPYFFTLQR